MRRGDASFDALLSLRANCLYDPAQRCPAGFDRRREAVRSGSEDGRLIQSIIDDGKIVPSEITIRLLQRAMDAAFQSKGATKFLIDGFPRNEEVPGALRG